MERCCSILKELYVVKLDVVEALLSIRVQSSSDFHSRTVGIIHVK